MVNQLFEKANLMSLEFLKFSWFFSLIFQKMAQFFEENFNFSLFYYNLIKKIFFKISKNA
jgi:hypothetical protein